MSKQLLLYVFVLLVGYSSASAQSRTVTGKITSSDDGTGLPGVSVLEKGTRNGTVTGFAGDFSINVQDGAILVLSFVGYATQEVAVGGRSVVDVVMQLDVTALEEVVVVGYGTQEKKDLTGSVIALNSKDFNKGVMSSPQDLLVGKMAGVQVVTNSGQPGSNATIRIRGGSSMSASNDPLIVIDGFPVDNANISGLTNPLSSINPNDIASVTVLKDASATAIYGARASNGVIIITTKKGQIGRPQINYNGQLSFSTPTQYVDVLSGDEFRAVAADLAAQGGYGITAEALERLGNENTDWQSEIYRTATSHDHNLSVSGTAKDIPFRASYGYTDQQGILKTTGMQRHTLNLNLNPSFLDDHLQINASVKTMNTKNNFGDQGAVGAAVAFDPTQPVRNGNDRFGGYFTWVNLSDTLPDGSMNPNGFPNTFSINNPVAMLEQTDNRSTVNRVIGNIQMDYRFTFLPELRFNINAGIDKSGGEGFNNAPAEAAWTYRNYTGQNGQRISYTGDNQSQLFDAYFNYVKSFGESRLDATAGYSWQHFEREGSNYNRNGDESQVIENSTFYNENYLVSFFGRLHYSIQDKYLITATLRNDGSSRFAEANRWGLFPAVAAAWNISNESFLQNVTAVSNLKLRAGYGVTGQQDIANNQYPYLAIYRQSIGGASYQFGDTYYPTLRPDPYDANIKWEETTTLNAGLDFGFAKNRISGSVDVYQRKTKDLINFIPIPAGSNFSNFLTTNVGDLENKGVELTLNAIAVQTSDLTWNVGANLSRNVNTITRLTKTDDPNYAGVDVGGISGGVGNFIQNNRVGYPVNSFYVFEQVYNEDGMPIEGLYVDRTGNGGVVTSNNLNKYHYQKPAPDYLIGVNSSLNYKSFDFSLQGRLSIGNYVYNNVFSGTTYASVYGQSGYYGNLRSAIEQTQFDNVQYWSDHYVENASFFKMDNMSAGYSVEDLLTPGLAARFSITVQNAFMVTKYGGIDPEVANGIDNNIYPRPRVFLMGVNLTF